MISPRKKIKALLTSAAGLAILAVLSPFLISGKFALGAFLVFDFLFIAYLWKNFNDVRITMDKDELEDEKISEIEMNVQKVIHKKL